MTTLVVLATTGFGLATATAAVRAGLVGRADRAVLVTACTTAMPEATPPLTELSGVGGLLARFDAVYDYNAALEPQHPSAWQPRQVDLPLWERHFRALWGLGEDDVHLLVESIQVPPARTVGRIFADARVSIYADGLMTYGPTRNAVPAQLAGRIESVLHLDLVPGLRPLLLREWDVPARVIPTADFRAVLDEPAGPSCGAVPNDAPTGAAAELPDGAAVLVGQYLAAGGLLTEAEEAELYATAVRRLAESGFAEIVFKPHPSAPASAADRLVAAAREHGARLTVTGGDALVESWLDSGRVAAVAGCFSTALLTAGLYGVPAYRVGTRLVLERLSPYENSNRIPVTLVDAVLSEPGVARRRPDPERLARLVGAVGYAMQPELLVAERPAAVAFLTAHYAEHARYFTRRRLSRLDLPGRLPRRPAGVVRSLVRRLARAQSPIASRPRRISSGSAG